MEIPYIVNARKDTGLNNSKIAIWLFLASEVMLFGGLFSSYIFLRVFADFPWPERALPVLPGLVNTFILIASSVTVVFAWAALKLRKWGMFVGNMTFTLICAAAFMVFKAREYSGKFHHHGVQTEDWAWIEGHVHAEEDGHGGNVESVHTDKLNFQVERSYPKYVDFILASAGDKVPTLSEKYYVKRINGDTYKLELLFDKGTELSNDVLATAREEFVKARTYNQKVRTKLLNEAWAIARKQVNINESLLKGRDYPDLKGLEDWHSTVKDTVNQMHNDLISIVEKEHKGMLISNGNMVFDADGVEIRFPSNWGRMSNSTKGKKTNVTLFDGTVASGEAGDSSFHVQVDGIDFRHLVMKNEVNPEIDVDSMIEKSPLLHMHGEGGDKMRKLWTAHKEWRKHFAAYLATEYGNNKEGQPKRVPTAVDNYRINWRQMVAYGKLDYTITAENWEQVDAQKPSSFYDLTSNKSFGEYFPEVHVERDQVRFDSAFSPKMNNYYAIYFTITGLHGLHVIGGAIVLGYYLFFGRKMYLSNPDWLANRVEVGGLFWHFVDLVWIFVFPIFYLM